jgi:hypothetical protein
MLCATNTSEIGSDRADFVTGAADATDVRRARVATPQAAGLKCLIGGRRLKEQEVSSLLQKPWFCL